MADLGQGFQCHVSAADGPLVVLLEQDGADQADDGGLVGKDADNVGAAFDFLVEAYAPGEPALPLIGSER